MNDGSIEIRDLNLKLHKFYNSGFNDMKTMSVLSNYLTLSTDV